MASWLPRRGDSVQISWLDHPGYRKYPSSLADELLSADAVDALLTGGSLRHPEVLVVRDGRPVDAKEFTATRVVSDVEFPDVVRVDRALEFLKEGCTLILNDTQTRVGTVRALCADFERIRGFRTNANVFLTPAHQPGLAPHSDREEVFVIQLAGTKRWRIYARPVPAIRGAVYTGAELGEPILDKILEPGAVLSVPSGFPHVAESLDSCSMHLSLSMHGITWRQVLQRALQAEDQAPWLDEPLARENLFPQSRAGSALRNVAEWLGQALSEDVLAGAVDVLMEESYWDGEPWLSGELARFIDGREAPLGTLVSLKDTARVRLTNAAGPVLHLHGARFRLTDRQTTWLQALQQSAEPVPTVGEIEDLLTILAEYGAIQYLRSQSC